MGRQLELSKNELRMTYAETIALVKQNQANSGKPGFNEYGVPLHACNGYRQDEHYWAFVRHRNETHPYFKALIELSRSIK